MKKIYDVFKVLGLAALSLSFTWTSCKKSDDGPAVPNPIVWRDVDAGLYHVAAIKSDGTLWLWGDNAYHQMGNGGSSDIFTPTKLNADTTWAKVFCGRVLTYAIKEDGSLWGWGKQAEIYTYIGDGTSTAKTTPVRIGNDNDWDMVSVGLFHTIALKKDGTLWAWGNNDSYQLGDSTLGTQLQPVNVLPSSKFKTICAGDDYSMAIKTDGTLWAWGSNLNGNLGNGTTSTLGSKAPIQVGAGNFQSVATASGHVIAIAEDGSVWTWGKNNEGQLGQGNTTPLTIPTKVSSLANVAFIDAVNSGSLAISNNGHLYVWGQYHTNTPELKTFEKPFTKAAVGYNFNIALTNDGKLYGWGTNNNGVMGQGNNSGSYNTFTEIR